MTLYNINPGGKNLMNTTAVLVGARRMRAFDTTWIEFSSALRLQSMRMVQGWQILHWKGRGVGQALDGEAPGSLT